MSEIHVTIPDQQPELEAAISDFIKEEFNQQIAFSKEPASDEIHKDVGLMDVVWLGLVFIATLETNIQFAERVKRMERVKKLLAAIKKSGKSVYLKFNKGPAVDLSKKSTDEIMDYLLKVALMMKKPNK